MSLSLFILRLSIIDKLPLILFFYLFTNLTLRLNFEISWNTLRSLNIFEFIILIAILCCLWCTIFITARTFHFTFMLPALTTLAYSYIISFIITNFFNFYFSFASSVFLWTRLILGNTARFTFYTLKLFLWSIRISYSPHLKSIIILVFTFSMNCHRLRWIFYFIVFICRKWLMDLFW